jgi:hypothetical protein
MMDVVDAINLPFSARRCRAAAGLFLARPSRYAGRLHWITLTAGVLLRRPLFVYGSNASATVSAAFAACSRPCLQQLMGQPFCNVPGGGGRPLAAARNTAQTVCRAADAPGRLQVTQPSSSRERKLRSGMLPHPWWTVAPTHCRKNLREESPADASPAAVAGAPRR